MDSPPPTRLPRRLLEEARSPDDELRKAARAQICAMAAVGSPAAIHEVIVLYQAVVWASLASLETRREIVEELAQDTWVIVDRECRKGMVELRMPAFARKVARNLWLDWKRKGVREEPTDPDELPPLRGASDPDKEWNARRVVEVFEAVVASRSPRDQQLLRLYYAGQTPTELGAAYGMTPHAVTLAVSHFRTALDQRLRALGLDDT